MFEAVGQRLEGDHLDLSFHNTKSWTNAAPVEGATPSLFLSVGDPASGPTVQLAVAGTLPQDIWLDTHYHGSDQFRAIIQGEFLVQTKRLTAGQFGYQSSGRPYREGMAGGSTKDLWMFAVHGDRRGARSTMTRRDGSFGEQAAYFEIGEDQLDRPVASPDDPYWKDVPGGSRGIAAMTTTLGPNQAGYAWGSFDDTKDWHPLAEGVVVSAGVLGPQSGAVIVMMHCESNSVAIPACSYATEIILAVVRGGCQIGGQHYGAGDVRVQRANAPLGAVVSGPDGADIVFFISDRRAGPKLAQNDLQSQKWKVAISTLIAELRSAEIEFFGDGRIAQRSGSSVPDQADRA